MNDELLKFQDIAAAVKKHALLVLGIVSVCLLVAFVSAEMLPKKFKSITVLNIKNSYFQMPVGGDIFSGGKDASEMYLEKQALIRQALDDPFYDKMGEHFGSYSSDKASPKRASERETLKKRVVWLPINQTNFQFSVVARTAEDSQKMTSYLLDYIMDRLIEERVRGLSLHRESLKRQLDALGLASGGATNNPIASTQPELLESELAGIEAKIQAMESQYTPSHPTVVALRRQADSIRQMLRSAKAGAANIPQAARQKVLLSPGAKGAKSEFFEDLSKKMSFLDIAMELERDKREVQYFEIVERPTKPLTYIFPKKKNFLLGGVLAGILLASIAVGFLQLKRAAQLTPQFASRFLNTPLIGVLPALRTPEGNFIETSLGGLKNAPAAGRRK